MPPPLVTCPTTTTAVPLSLAKRISWPEHSRTWPDVARRALQRLGVDRLDGVDDDDVGRDRARRADDGLEPGFAQHVHRAGVLGQPVGAEPELVGRLLAAGVEHRPPRRLQPRRGLKQQRGLADAGLAADQDHRARHDAAAEDEVEFVDAGAPALERLGGDVAQAGRRGVGTAAPPPCRRCRRAAARADRPAPPPPRSTPRTPSQRPTHLACSWPHSVQR